MEADLIVIGGGAAGYRAAVTAAHLGARAVLVERDTLGGTCLNQGCIPKQSLLHLASLIEDVAALNGRGLAGEVKGDFPAALAHKDSVVRGIRDNLGQWLARLGVNVLRGEARLAARGRVCVRGSNGEEEFVRRIARGKLRRMQVPTLIEGVPQGMPDVVVMQLPSPVDGRVVMTSREFMLKLDRLPAAVLCVGGGAIGTELGYLLAQFGARVTIAEQAGRLLDSPRIPETAADLLERKLERIGVDVRKGVTVAQCEVGDARARVRLTDGFEAEFDLVLVAVGRAPVTSGLDLAAAGVALTDGGFVRVNEYLEASAPGVYAIGDARPGPMTANAALHDAKLAVSNALGLERLRTNYFRVPVVIHSALEIAAVGLTEEQAEEAGFDTEVARARLAAGGKARAQHEREGFVEVVHDSHTGQLLGGCIVGPEAGEQIHLLAAACQSERGLWFLKDLHYSHPSWCEELEAAIDPFAARLARSGRTLFRPGILAKV
ncbi:MAG: NAD(P)/FAD-dependent oxidoreductase [Betaproteobacteria bacterium]|nr:NAD(P)/FAD-dependent oxidoreductase [Betaproteobacteria bacterium]